jgi:hypothetical protein
MSGKFSGQSAQIFQPTPLVSRTVYGQPDSVPGFAPYPAAPTKRSNGQVSYEFPPTGTSGLPVLTAINPSSQSQATVGQWQVVVTGTCDPVTAELILVAPDGTERNSHEFANVTPTTFTVIFTDAPTDPGALGPGGYATLRQGGVDHGSLPWTWLP